LGQSNGDGSTSTSTQADKSCIDYGIFKGEGLATACQNHCQADNFEVFDWAAPRESDPTIVDRNTWCRCLDPPSGNTTFECSDIEEGVWDLATALQTCEKLNITSGTTCSAYCQTNIDPKAFEFRGSGANLQCYCGGNPQLHICGTSPGVMVVPGWLGGIGWSMAMAVVFGMSL
jgi:hypothetical protein